MTGPNFEQAVARAVVERTFRARLLADPADALADYGLHSGDLRTVATVKALTLEQLTASLLRLLPLEMPTLPSIEL